MLFFKVIQPVTTLGGYEEYIHLKTVILNGISNKNR
jgi:hypothetical protein